MVKQPPESSLGEIYDRFAATYDANRGLFDMSDVFDAFYARLPAKQGRVLDLGCGAGEPFSRMFIDRGWTVTGVDFSRGMLALAARYVPEMRAIYADMREVAFKPEQFEAITAIYSLFHVPSREHVAMFDKFHRWLSPEGKALFTYATREYTGSDEFDGFREFMGERLYYSHKRPEALYADLARAGFAIEAADYREIGNETFLWVTVSKSAGK